MVIASFAAILGLMLHPHTTVMDDSVASPLLGRTMMYRALIPSQADEDTLLPALLLLHGYGGSHRDWTDMTAIEAMVDSLPLVVIMPDGKNSWYVNAAGDSTERYEDALIHDLLPAVRKKYGIDSTRIAVAGLSMGGFGALSLGLRNPHIFRFVGALSASLDVPRGIPELEQHGRGGLRASLERTFGTDSLSWQEHDLFRLALAADTARFPYIVLVNGIQDEFRHRLLLYRAFADVLRSRGCRYEYHETPGRHTWDYWGREIQGVIRRLTEILDKAPHPYPSPTSQ